MDEQRLELLGRMLYFADQAYEGESERTLNARLAKHGALPSKTQRGRVTRGQHYPAALRHCAMHAHP